LPAADGAPGAGGSDELAPDKLLKR